MRRRALVSIGLAFALASAAAEAQGPVIDVRLSARAEPLRPRIATAAQRAGARYSEWLGNARPGRISLGDDPSNDIVIAIDAFDSPGAMRIESRVASGLASAWLGHVATDDEFRAGASWYLQSRVVAELFDLAFHRPGYAHDARCFFGCRVPWAMPSLPLDRWVVAPDGMPRAFTTLERELGWPMLQGALRAVAETGRDPIAVMSAATGRDLSAVFLAARHRAAIDPGIASFESAPGDCGSPCYRTRIVIREQGPVPLPLTLRVLFDGGQHVDARWNGGRDRFEFESASPATAAYLDPDRVWQLDRNPFNNSRVVPSPTNVPVWKWMARWMVWLQDALLTQSFPV